MNKNSSSQITPHGTAPVVQAKDWQSPESLTAALRHVARNGGKAPGPDGILIESIQGKSNAWLNELRIKLRKGTYVPGQPRICAIRKTNSPNEYRKLGIYNLEDRIVATAIKNSLQPIIETRLHDSAFAFRPKRSVASVMRSVETWIRKASLEKANEIVAVTIDIADCFDSIRHERILASLRNIADQGTVNVVKGFFSRNLPRSNQSMHQSNRGIGIVQGNPLSPLFCNLVLTPFDELMNRQRRQCASFRYADDVLIMSVNMTVATKALQTANEVLTQHGLRLKTIKIRFNSFRDGVNWLGMRICACPSANSRHISIKVAISDSAIAIMKDRIGELIDCQNGHRRASTHRQSVDQEKIRKSLQSAIRAWLAGYTGAQNTREVRIQLEQYAEGYLNKKRDPPK